MAEARVQVAIFVVGAAPGFTGYYLWLAQLAIPVGPTSAGSSVTPGPPLVLLGLILMAIGFATRRPAARTPTPASA